MTDMTVLDGEGIVREAEREFLHNPAFRSKVLLALASVRSLSPEPLSPLQEHLVTLSAATGLFLHGYKPSAKGDPSAHHADCSWPDSQHTECLDREGRSL